VTCSREAAAGWSEDQAPSATVEDFASGRDPGDHL
jgi:hypothetical protein